MIAWLFMPGQAAQADAASRLSPKVGETYEIVQSYETSEQKDGGSSGRSNGRNTLIERVIGVRSDGLELEFDLPKGASAQARAQTWQFPVRVFRPVSGSMELLNRSALEERIDQWLRAARLTRAACGKWIFTWNAFRVECDPQSVVGTLEALDLRSARLDDGAPYRADGALGIGRLAKTSVDQQGETFVVTLQLDPDAVRRARAESDVVVGEISQQPVSLEAALKERVAESVSGTMSITIETDSRGQPRRRATITKVEIKGIDGQRENRTTTEIVERHRR